jgi:hypothetical protein
MLMALAAFAWIGTTVTSSAAAADLAEGWSAGVSLPAAFEPTWDMSSAYFPPLDQVVVFGGSPKTSTESWSNQTWLYESGAWRQGAAAPTGLVRRGGAAMAYLPEIGKIVLFGGAGDAWPPYRDTWLFNGSTWTAGPAAPAGLTGRTGARMAYLPDIQKLVLFGGAGTVPYRDTWLFDGTSWAPGPSTPAAVSARSFFGMAYVPDRHALYIAGGNGKTDGWYFDGSTWTPGPSLDPVGPLERIQMAYDPDVDALMAFGGYGPGDATDDLVMMKGGSWSQVSYWTTGQGWPDPRGDAGLVWHPGRDALMMIAGIPIADGSTALSDAWFFREIAPYVTSATLSPAAPDASDAITLSWGDIVGGYKTWTKQIEWYVNDVLVPDDEDIRLSPDQFDTGDQIHARIRYTDDLGVTGPWVYSQTVGVGDRPPSIQNVSLAPQKAYVTSTIIASAGGVNDPDGDPVTLHYAWNVNGQPVAGVDEQALTPDHFDEDDVVNVTVTATDPSGATSAPVTSPDRLIYWNLSPRDNLSPGQSVAVNGGGYAPGERVDIKLDSPFSPTVASMWADLSGDWVGGQVPVPSPYPGGTHVLYGVGANSGIVGRGEVLVVPIIHVAPGSLAAGDTVTVTGDGYVPNETVSVQIGDGPVTPVVANASGSFSVSLTSPEVAYGFGLVTAAAPSATDVKTFSVLPRMEAPETARPGDLVTVKAHGFGPVEAVYVRLDSSSSIVTGFTTDAHGAGQVQVPLNVLFGKHTINLQGAATLITRSATVNLPAAMTLTPSSGPVGTTVTIDSGPGWAPGSNVKLYWQSTKFVKTVTADSTGSVHTTYKIPSHKRGGVTIKLTGTNPAVMATATFTVT